MAVTMLRFEVVEQIDHAPLQGLVIEARAVVKATKKIGVIDLPDDTGRAPQTPTTGGQPYAVMARGVQAFEELTIEKPVELKTMTTVASGTTDFVWDPAVDPLYKAALDEIAQRMPGVAPLVYFHVRAGVGAGGAGPFTRLDQPIVAGRERREALGVSLASTIVGHVTDTTARLWFRRTLETTQGMTVRLAIDERGTPLRGRRPSAVTFAGGPHPTAVVDVAGLKPATDYGYTLVFSGPGSRRWLAGRGSFRTADPAATSLRIAFASCFDPEHPDDIERWTTLRRDWDPDLVLLIGDQVYGDYTRPALPFPLAGGASTASVPYPPPPIGWPARYDNLYRRGWGVPAVRDVLRTRPTYMILDDHDVADDWGTTFDRNSGDGRGDQVRAGLVAYEAYQHAHNPPTAGRPTNAAYDYSFVRGAVAFFAFDLRSQRGLDTANPVLGVDQMRRFDLWASSPEVTSADVLVIVSPVPFAFCDAELATAVFKTIAATHAAIDFLGGGGLLWDTMETAIGWSPHELIMDVETSGGRIVEPDLADQWANPAFQPELAHVLDRLFDLQNDPTHRRAVIVLTGDSHIGGFHKIISPRKPAHADNNVIYQIMSSPIGTTPEAGLADKLSDAGALLGSFPIAHAGPAVTDFFRGKAEVLWGARNFGTVNVRRVGPGRVYELRASLHLQRTRVLTAGESRLDLRVDLDAGGRPSALFTQPGVTLIG